MIAASFWAGFFVTVAVASGVSVVGLAVAMIAAPGKVRWRLSLSVAPVLVLVCAAAVGGAISFATLANWPVS